MAGRQHGQAGPAMPAGNDPGFLEMIPGGFVHNAAVSGAYRAGVLDRVAGPGTYNIGVEGLGSHGERAGFRVFVGRAIVPEPEGCTSDRKRSWPGETGMGFMPGPQDPGGVRTVWGYTILSAPSV